MLVAVADHSLITAPVGMAKLAIRNPAETLVYTPLLKVSPLAQLCGWKLYGPTD